MSFEPSNRVYTACIRKRLGSVAGFEPAAAQSLAPDRQCLPAGSGGRGEYGVLPTSCFKATAVVAIHPACRDPIPIEEGVCRTARRQLTTGFDGGKGRCRCLHRRDDR
jgi:hypothetical protein